MTQTHTINIQDLCPFAGTNDPAAAPGEEKRFRLESTGDVLMELPVNNYLKTPDEIEWEFRYGTNPRRLNVRKDNLHNLSSIMTTDGYLNIHNLDEALSGFMEENY